MTSTTGEARISPAISPILNMQEEVFAGLGVDQGLPGRQRGLHRLDDELEDVVDPEEDDPEPDEDGDQRIDDSPAQLVKMVQEGHLAAAA